MQNKLIILRGPSGSGKSTIAHLLQRISHTDILIISQDYYRHTLLANKKDTKNIVPTMIHQDTLIALNAGYTVIVEGIFRKEKYLPMFQALTKDFKGKTYTYYFDISFAETTNRHTTRDKAKLFGTEEMRVWYRMAAPLGTDGEHRISVDMTAEKTVQLIQKQTRVFPFF